jgi:hypothetical protein
MEKDILGYQIVHYLDRRKIILHKELMKFLLNFPNNEWPAEISKTVLKVFHQLKVVELKYQAVISTKEYSLFHLLIMTIKFKKMKRILTWFDNL